MKRKSKIACGRFASRFRTRHLTALLAACLGAETCRADQTITVTSLVDALSLPGQVTLRGAIQTADTDSGTDTIQFAPSLFTSGPATLNMAGSQFPITNSVNIVGPGASSLTLNAQQLSRVFDISSATAQVSMSGMTLTNGVASGPSGLSASGGAVFNAGNLTLTNMTVSNSQSQSTVIDTDTITYGGGGIYNNNGGLTLNNCLVSGNRTTSLINGGGIESTGGTVNVQNSTFSNNTAGGDGGSISANDGSSLTLNKTTADASISTRYFNTSPQPSTLVMTNSQVGTVSAFGTSTISNSTTGALNAYESVTISASNVGPILAANYISNGVLNINHSTIAQINQQSAAATIINSTFKPSGGATYAISVGQAQGTTFLENDTVSGYVGTGSGTVYFPVGANATVRNCTIAGNQASVGGGIDVASGNLSMDSTIVADNTATTIASDLSGYVTGQNNLIKDPTGAFLLSPNNLIGVDPDLGPLQDNGGPTLTMALLPGSPAIDAGSNIDDLLYDQRGFPRVSGAGPDIGAYELQTPEPGAAALIALLFPALLRRRRSARGLDPQVHMISAWPRR